MTYKNAVLATLLAVPALVGQSHAVAAANWVGTADYTASPLSITAADVVGPFSVYDAGSGVVLLEATGSSGPLVYYDGYYQSFVTRHELNGSPVAAPNLDLAYELTVVADFTETLDTSNGTFSITGGSFAIYLDKAVNRNFTGDSGFTDGDKILWGDITSGSGTSMSVAGMVFGATDLNIAVKGYDTNVYSPDTITNAGGIFTLRLGNPYDAPFLGPISNVQGHAVDSGDLRFAADGYLALAVPEAETYAMMLAGLGLVGFMARRRTRSLG